MEAVFQSLKGVYAVKQGWIAPQQDPAAFSEAVLATCDESKIPLTILIEIHLATHSATSQHALRNKYRSAMYVFNEDQKQEIKLILQALQKNYVKSIITDVLLFESFKSNTDNYLNYYRKRSCLCDRETILGADIRIDKHPV